jgi:hypothetical protein
MPKSASKNRDARLASQMQAASTFESSTSKTQAKTETAEEKLEAELQTPPEMQRPEIPRLIKQILVKSDIPDQDYTMDHKIKERLMELYGYKQVEPENINSILVQMNDDDDDNHPGFCQEYSVDKHYLSSRFSRYRRNALLITTTENIVVAVLVFFTIKIEETQLWHLTIEVFCKNQRYPIIIPNVATPLISDLLSVCRDGWHTFDSTLRISTIFLEVDAFNTSLINFYRRFGIVSRVAKTGRKRAYLQIKPAEMAIPQELLGGTRKYKKKLRKTKCKNRRIRS